MKEIPIKWWESKLTLPFLAELEYLIALQKKLKDKEQ